MESQSYYSKIYGKNDNFCDLDRPLRVNCAGYANMQKIGRISTQRNDWYLQLMDEGEMLTGEDEHFSCLQFIIRPPKVPYHYEKLREQSGYFWIHFTGTWVEELLTSLKLQPERIYSLPPDTIGTLTPEFLRLFRELALRREGFDEMTVSVLMTILVRLGRAVSDGTSDTAGQIRHRLEKSVHYIHRHYTKRISLCELAGMEHLSVTRYRELFREAFGSSPTDYITDLRLTDACELLADSDLSVTEVSEMCGYGDVLYFCRIFRKKKGISPGNFRKHSEEA